MANKTNKSNHSNSIQMTEPNNLNASFSAPIPQSIMAQDSMNIPPKMLYSEKTVNQQKNIPNQNTSSNNIFHAIANKITSSISKTNK